MLNWFSILKTYIIIFLFFMKRHFSDCLSSVLKSYCLKQTVQACGNKEKKWNTEETEGKWKGGWERVEGKMVIGSKLANSLGSDRKYAFVLQAWI